MQEKYMVCYPSDRSSGLLIRKTTNNNNNTDRSNNHRWTRHPCWLVLQQFRIFGGKSKKHRLRYRDCNLEIKAHRWWDTLAMISMFGKKIFNEVQPTFSSWCSLFSLWHSIVISPSSSLCLVPLLVFRLLLGCKWKVGEAGGEVDAVGEWKSSSQYTIWDGKIIICYIIMKEVWSMNIFHAT